LPISIDLPKSGDPRVQIPVPEVFNFYKLSIYAQSKAHNPPTVFMLAYKFEQKCIGFVNTYRLMYVQEKFALSNAHKRP